MREALETEGQQRKREHMFLNVSPVQYFCVYHGLKSVVIELLLQTQI
jgi:hypothetical protein